MDIEWGKDGVDGKLYILQARPERAQPGRGPGRAPLQAEGHAPWLVEGRAIGHKIGTGPVRWSARSRDGAVWQPGDVLSPT
jgi:pyruvate,water dikinase